jgi:hypothetical protein
MSEKSILSAMAYVDLNPIRADIAKRLRSSKHTSIRERCIDIEGARFVASFWKGWVLQLAMFLSRSKGNHVLGFS